MSLPKSWEVEIRSNGETILTIGSWGLCGIENISDHADLVRNCAENLVSFIGPENPEPFICETDNKSVVVGRRVTDCGGGV